MIFEFVDEDLEIIEKLMKYNLEESTKKDIMNFLENYKFKKRFHETVGHYIKLTEEKDSNKSEGKLVSFLYVRSIEDRSSTKEPIALRTDQTIMYSYTAEDILAYSGVSTKSRILSEKYADQELDILVVIKTTSKYQVEIISRDDYENELVNSVNIN